MRRALSVAAGLPACLVVVLAAVVPVVAQFGPPPPEPPGTPKQKQRLDITGNWVSVVHEDWRFRMITAPKGDTVNIPLNAAGKKIADAWDAAKDEAAADKCKAYGAPNLMRVPSRFRITWADDATLKIETRRRPADAAAPVRAPKTPPAPSRQGLSIARWQGRASLQGGDQPSAGRLPAEQRRALQRQRDHGGKLRRREAANGEEWLIIDTIVTDPTYLFRRSSAAPTSRRRPTPRSGTRSRA